MADEIKCNLCGGTDFYNEAGHYYCNECQTQSQEIHEHVFATPEDVTTARRTSSKRIRTAKKAEDNLTSWECYNYILIGLVDELIELGANAKLKQIVRLLWFKYLNKLEVVQNVNDPNASPKLSAVNSTVDAAIVYGRCRPKKKRSRTPSPTSSSDPSTMDAASLRKEKSKLRRSLILAEYDEFSNTMQSEDVSLQNQSLVSLKSGSDISSKDKEKFLRYNKNAKKELLKIMPKRHLKAHCRDTSSTLDCHKLSHKSFSWKYSHGPDVLSRSRIYSILYLGLLIVKDKIQLGDMMRFIREGSLSYHEIDHFFPDEFNRANLNIKTWNHRHKLMSHSGMRNTTAEMAEFIDVVGFVPRQNLVGLCQRYCNELNLPDEVMGYTLNLMSKCAPKFQFDSHSTRIPNYEGRVMSLIMFVLKLLFGLDEATENSFSTYAKNVNTGTHLPGKKMFVWEDWAHFIQYRHLVLTQHHFPTQYLFDNENVQNTNLFVGFMTELNAKHERDDTLSREAEVLKPLLEKLKNRQAPLQNRLHFPPSLTPFRDYVEVLLNSAVPKEKNYLTEVLEINFRGDSLDFLTKAFSYLEEINKSKKVGIKHRGENNDFKLIQINNMKVVRERWRKNVKKEVFIKLCDGKARSSNCKLKTTKLEENITELNTKQILKNFKNRHMPSYRKTINKLLKSHSWKQSQSVTGNTGPTTSQKISSHSQNYCNTLSHSRKCDTYPFASQSESETERETYIHFNPYDRYWLKTFNVCDISREDFNNFFDKYPQSFKLVLNECARVIEQSPKELFEEFNDVEVYLCYVAKFTVGDKDKEVICNSNLRRAINKAMKYW